jgi:hypothetical protein
VTAPIAVGVGPGPGPGLPCTTPGPAGVPQNQAGDPPGLGSQPLVTLFNCQPTAGDVSEVTIQGGSIEHWSVDWGDASAASTVKGFGCNGLSVSPPIDHVYRTLGFHTVAVTSTFACGGSPTTTARLLVDVVSGPPPPAAPGAQTCHGLGPALSGSTTPRQGMSWQDLPSPTNSPFPFRVSITGCKVPVGGTVTVTGSFADQSLASDDGPWSTGNPYSWPVQTAGLHHLDISGTQPDGTKVIVHLTFVGV